MYIWRDQFDENIYHFGVQLFGGEATAWLITMHCDSISDLFGHETYVAIEYLDFSDGPVEFDIHQFAVKEAIEKEREGCALAIERWTTPFKDEQMASPLFIARAIRERGED